MKKRSPAFKVPPLKEYADVREAARITVDGVRAAGPGVERGWRAVMAYTRAGIPHLFSAYQAWLTGEGSVAKKLGGTLAVIVLVVRGANHGRLWMAGAALAFFIGCSAAMAYRAGFRLNGPVNEPDAEPDADDLGQHPDEVIRVLVEVSVGRSRNVFLRELMEPLGRGDLAGVRKDLEGAGVPVRDVVRVGADTGVGIHKSDMPAPPPLSDEPLSDQETAGQVHHTTISGLQPTTSTTIRREESANGALVIYTPPRPRDPRD